MEFGIAFSGGIYEIDCRGVLQPELFYDFFFPFYMAVRVQKRIISLQT